MSAKQAHSSSSDHTDLTNVAHSSSLESVDDVPYLGPENQQENQLRATLSRQSTSRTLERRLSNLNNSIIGNDDEDIDAVLEIGDLDWDGPTDKGNPQNWPKWKKWYVTMTTAMVALVVSFGSSLYSAGVLDMVERKIAGETLAIAGLTLYVLGLGFGPLFAAPLSELYGRNVIYFVSLPISMIFTIGVGFSHKIREILVLRFFAGTFGSPALAVCSGTIVDIWELQDTEVAMAFFILAPFCGPVLGPVIGGYAVEQESWKWSQWVDLFAGALVLPFLLLCPETYKPTILKRRAKKRNLNIKKDDIKMGEYLKQVVNIYIRKPGKMLVVEPIVLVFSIWSAFNFAILFGFFEAFPVIFRGVYHMSLGNSGLAFLGIGLGLVLGVAIYLAMIFLLFWKKNPDGTRGAHKDGKLVPPVPETRLLPAKIGALMLPISLFWVGWTGRKESIHWIVPIIGAVPFGIGLILIFFSTIVYFSLSYPPVSLASAMAANNLLRYLLASVFPLFCVQMYKNLGIGWATSTFAFISIAMIPIPWIFEKFGPKLRSKSEYGYYAIFRQQMALKAEQEKLAEMEKHTGVVTPKETAPQEV